VTLGELAAVAQERATAAPRVVAPPPPSSASEARARRRIRTIPSPLEFWAYVYYFPGLLTGPFCSLQVYLDSVTGAQLKVW
jgi:D-alanyl-lipoteichoic acid acyltransferase DltB (MBOAT superfamily)